MVQLAAVGSKAVAVGFACTVALAVGFICFGAAISTHQDLGFFLVFLAIFPPQFFIVFFLPYFSGFCSFSFSLFLFLFF